MSAPDPAGASQPPLLLVIDPAARMWDGESVRIARDVLCAGAEGVKVCLPENPEEAERALARRGSRRPVVVGDDRALLRAVRLLHRERELDEAVLSMVPVGAERSVALACGLGVPADAVSAARTALDGVERRLGLLIDDSGGVVLGGIRIPGPSGEDEVQGRGGALRATAALVRARRARPSAGQRLRVEADGELLADLDRPVTEVSVVSPRPSDWGDPNPRPSDWGGPNPRPSDWGGPNPRPSDWGGPNPRPSDWGGPNHRPSGWGGGRPRPMGRGDPRPVGTGAAGALRHLGNGSSSASASASAPDSGAGHRSRGRAESDAPWDGRHDGRHDGRWDGQRSLAQVTVRPEGADDAEPVRARAKAVTVSGPDFHYRADALVGGPVRVRTWTALAGAWGLTLPG
ncbi:hypothetical protein K378_02889 [Streptomyces sp. Amel2xB2]|uniref:diacylglycerol kinase n=1 Tax=Streptomyces sp. Amel2xB2 TaxID=1305829 RepID=UPI000DBF60B5|nr:diacylglycerol kinase [Streptomyces sp. Amel2xB2]RAJ66716.1 hypothetical protein K378_02889 [Streptomyces sp. Amel2xB2]